MTPRLFTGLGIAALVSLVLAALVNMSADSWDTGVAKGAKLFPTLTRDADRIASITLKRADKSVTLEQEGGAWSLKDRGGYPVQGERVRALLLKLADAELVGRKTRNPDRFGLLELENVGGKDAKSRLVTIVDAKGAKLAEAIIGKRSTEQFAAGKGGTYVRRPGEKETWLANAEIDIDPAITQWVDTAVFEAQIAKVRRVSVEFADGAKTIVEREAGKPANKDGYKLVDMAAGKKLKTDYALEDVVNAFARMEMEDVRKAGATDAKPAAGDKAGKPATATFESENGLKITLTVRSQGDARWAMVTATGDGEAKPDADKITVRTKGWEFKLPSWKHDQIFKTHDDLTAAASG
jgi:hypothetical protein